MQLLIAFSVASGGVPRAQVHQGGVPQLFGLAAFLRQRGVQNLVGRTDCRAPGATKITHLFQASLVMLACLILLEC